MLTLNQVNKALKEKGYDTELVKGKGYFYFTYVVGLNYSVSTSVYVNSVNQLSLAEWVEEYEELFNNVKKHNEDYFLAQI